MLAERRFLYLAFHNIFGNSFIFMTIRSGFAKP